MEEVVKISKEDFLVMQNAHLKAQMIAQEVRYLELQLKAKQDEMVRAHSQLGELRMEMEKKYGVDLTTHWVREEDRAVLPHTPDSLAFIKSLQGKG